MKMAPSQENFWWRITFLIIEALYSVHSQYPPDMMMHENPPVLDTKNLTIEAMIGSRVELPCKVKNADDSLVRWNKGYYQTMISEGQSIKVENDSRISVNKIGDDQWNLVIENVQESDSDGYTCMVTLFPPQMKEVTLKVYSAPTIDKSSLRERYVIQQDMQLDISCHVTGNPKPHVKWVIYRFNPQTTKEEKPEIVSTGTRLLIHRMNRGMDGIYRCEAKNMHGIDMYETLIQTSYAPITKTDQKEILVKEGSVARLQCEAESMPKPIMAWQKEGEVITTNSKYKLSMYADSETKLDTTLEFLAYKTDEGRYICSAVNEHGQNNCIITVIVAADIDNTESPTSAPEQTTKQTWVTRTHPPYKTVTPALYSVHSQFPPDMMMPENPPVLDNKPLTIEAMIGSRVELPCKVKNADDSFVWWYKGYYQTMISEGQSIKVENDSRTSLNKIGDDQWNLVIENVQESDSDVYTCIVTHMPPQLKEVTLKVYSAPTIDKSSLRERYVIQQDMQLDISCHVTGNPKPHVKWVIYRFNPQTLKEDKPEIVSTGTRLLIHRMNRGMDGIYRCEAKNMHGIDMYETLIQTSLAADIDNTESPTSAPEQTTKQTWVTRTRPPYKTVTPGDIQKEKTTHNVQTETENFGSSRDSASSHPTITCSLLLALMSALYFVL